MKNVTKISQRFVKKKLASTLKKKSNKSEFLKTRLHFFGSYNFRKSKITSIKYFLIQIKFCKKLSSDVYQIKISFLAKDLRLVFL